MTEIGLTYCLLTTVCWALSPVFLRKSLETFDNTETNAVRSLGVIAVSSLICLISNPSLIVWKHGINAFAAIFAMTVLGNVAGDLCYIVAIGNIGVGRALSTSNSYPIFVSLISIYWLGEIISAALWIGMAIIIAGLALLNCSGKNSAAAPGKKPRSNKLGFFMAILASVLWAFALTIQKWVLITYNMEASTLIFWRAAVLCLTTWTIWYFNKKGAERKHLFNAGFKKWLSPSLAGAFSLAVGGIMFAQALKTVPISIASPITASNPVIGAIMAKIAFNEKLSPIQWLGILMVIAGGIEVSS